MKKKLLFVVTLCVMLLFACTAGAAPLQEDGFDYYIENGKAIISGYQGDKTDIVVPSHIGKYEVTGLAYDCFSGYDHLTSIKLPNTLRTIGWSAFAACRGLTSIEIPAGVTEIGRYAFSGCTNLERVSLPDSLVNLRRYAFNDCYSLRELVIPANVKDIPGDTLLGCGSMSKLTILGRDTTYQTIAAFIMLERHGFCEVYCWEGSPIDQKWGGHENFPIRHLDAQEVSHNEPIKVVSTGAAVNPDTVTEENLPAYVPSEPVKKPTLLLTRDVSVQAATVGGKNVKLNNCFVTHEVLVEKDNMVTYDLSISTNKGEPVSVEFSPAQPLLMPYPAGMSYKEAMGMQFTVEHRKSHGVEMFSTVNGSLLRTKGGLLLYTSSFSPFTITWEETADPSVLPKTGDETPSVAMLLGMIVLCCAAGYVLKRRAA